MEVKIRREVYRKRYYMTVRVDGKVHQRQRWSSRPSSSRGTVNKEVAHSLWNAGEDIDPTVAVDVASEVAVGSRVTAHILDQSYGTWQPIAVAIPVPPGDDIQLPVTIQICHVTTFVGIHGQHLNLERYGMLS